MFLQTKWDDEQSCPSFPSSGEVHVQQKSREDLHVRKVRVRVNQTARQQDRGARMKKQKEIQFEGAATLVLSYNTVGRA
jgi:hypothetical protein